MSLRFLRRIVAAVQRPRRRVARVSGIHSENLESRTVFSGVNPTAAMVGAVHAGGESEVSFEVGPIGKTGRHGFDVGPVGSQVGQRGFEVGPIGRVDIDSHTQAHASGMSSSALPVPRHHRGGSQGFDVGPIGKSGRQGFDVGPIGRQTGQRGFEVGPIGRVDVDSQTEAHASGMSSSALPVPGAFKGRVG